MKREFIFATVLAAAMSIGASAQSATGQAGTAGQSGTMAASSSAEQTPNAEKQANVTLTGCVENGKPLASSATGTSGSTASGSDTMGTSGSSNASSDGKFVLTNVTGAPAASISASERVVLSGKDKDLEPHVGHKVEITGKWEKDGSSAATSATAGTPGSSNSANGAFKVSSVKMIAASCSSH